MAARDGEYNQGDGSVDNKVLNLPVSPADVHARGASGTLGNPRRKERACRLRVKW
jgi:hypothetical protein